jgi:beta-glucosidase
MVDGVRFPREFSFGVATAAYQVEGHIENDWSEWERAGRLKDPAQRCGRGVEHWSRFDRDVQLAKDVGCDVFRVSLEWARIEPVRGHFDEATIAEYRERLVRMKAAGVRPAVTLHHFTHPKWFHRETPWHEPASVETFRRYARVCAQILRGLDALVITFNEPMVLLLGGYLQGCIPPGIADGKKAMVALGNIARAHVAAREEVLRECSGCRVGTSQNAMVFRPDRWWHPIDRAVTRLATENYNHAFSRALLDGELRIFMPGVVATRQLIPGAKDSIDFIGLNYYTRAHLRFVPRPPFMQFHYRDVHGRGLTHIGWEDYPEGFSQVILEAKREYGKPIWITENGIDDRGGERRSSFLYDHWKQLLDAMRQGADVRGYMYWSLMDNFEWLEGWGPRFGLYYVDFDTLERHPTPACHYFRQIATTRILVPPNPETQIDPAPAPAFAAAI